MLRPQASRNVRSPARVQLGPVLVALVLGASACAGSRPLPIAPSSAATRTPAAAPTPNPPMTAPAKPPPVPSAPDLGAVLASCAALQTRAGIPLSCRAGYEGSTLTMVAHFESQVQLLAYRDALHAQLGVPFCQAAARSGQAARVTVEQHGRGRFVWDCQRGAWSAWQAAARPNPPAPAAVCQALERDPGMPVRCQATAVNGTATMTLRFASEELAQPLLALMDEDVATPFCMGSTAAGQAALVQLRYDASKRGRSYNCETRTWGDWYSTEARRAPPPTSAEMPSPPAAASSPSARSGST